MTKLLASLTLLASSLAVADITMVTEVDSLGKKRTVTMSVKGSRASMEFQEADGVSRGMLRDADSKKLWLLDHVKKTVTVITEEDSKAMEARQAQFRAQMKAQLEKMPAEQRARIEATMLGGDPDAKPPVMTYEKKGTKARTIAGYSCEEYVVKREGVVRGDGCFASWKSVGMTAEEFRAVMLKAMPTAATAGPMMHAFDASATSPGLPVERTMTDDKGAVTAKTTLVSLSKKALAAEKYELPKGYAEKSMAESMPVTAPPPARP